jgi:hypothetical protein
MHPLSPPQLRQSLINATRSERVAMVLPKELDQLDWDQLDVLGWRDPREPQRGYLISERKTGPVGIMLRAPDSVPRTPSAVCALCRSNHSAGQVLLFTARRAGQAGRDGNTVGTYICADLRCTEHIDQEVRAALARQQVTPDPAVPLPDPGELLLTRRRALLEQADQFIDHVRDRTFRPGRQS